MIDFSKKKFLVVDDFSEFRSSIRGILRLLGVQDIDMAANGNEVLEQCRHKRYDVILHDYNLGDGLNGQQVLEQLHAEQLLSPHCIFIMVTAESTQAMVLAALECQPDDYLTKPFNKVTLQTRLERSVRRKQVLAPVLTAVESADSTTVLQACHDISQQDPRYAVLCHTYLATALADLGRYQELAEFLEEHARSRPTGWNLQALAKLWLQQGKLEQTTGLLTAAVRQFPMMPELLDMQAELARLNNDLPATVDALQQAVSMSPNTLRRQIKLACHAWLNNDPATAQQAIRQLWDIGRYSSIFDAELLWQLASMLSTATTAQKALHEADQWLSTIEKNHKNAVHLLPATALLRAVEQQRKNPDAAPSDLTPIVHSLTEHQHHYAAITLLQLGDWLAHLGEQTAAQALWQFAAQRHAGTLGILEQINTRLATYDTQPLREALALCQKAIALHYQEHNQAAQDLFEQALTLAPHLITLNIAAAHLYQDQVKQSQAQANQGLQACLKRIVHLSKLEPESVDFVQMQSSLELIPW